MKMQLVILCALVCFAAFANGNATYRDAMGRNQGSSSTYGNRTTFRDAQGRLQGTATTDSSGQRHLSQGRLKGTKK